MKVVHHQHGDYTGFIFFWITSDYMSNWHSAPFVADKWTWSNSEQFFMYLKCGYFDDEAGTEKCKITPNPKDVKAIGRAIPNYNDEEWTRVREEVMFQANLLKFRQNPDLAEKLMDTEGYHLVEASPVDGVWGIKLGESDPRAPNPEQWEGLNLLGICLERVRKLLIIERDLTEVNTLGIQNII